MKYHACKMNTLGDIKTIHDRCSAVKGRLVHKQ